MLRLGYPPFADVTNIRERRSRGILHFGARHWIDLGVKTNRVDLFRDHEPFRLLLLASCVTELNLLDFVRLFPFLRLSSLGLSDVRVVLSGTPAFSCPFFPERVCRYARYARSKLNGPLALMIVARF